MRSQLRCSLILCFGLFATQIFAARDFTKLIEETFELREGGRVTIENQYGRVDVRTWDQELVKVEVRVTTRARVARKGEETLDRIDVDFSHSDHYVNMETEIKTTKSVWWFIQDWLGDADVSIDYEVYMPRRANLQVDHKYGKLELEELEGDAEIDLKNGDLEVDLVTGELRLNLSHGNGTINKANITDAELSFYKLRLNDANEVEIDGRFSRVSINSANEIEARSTNTKYFLGDVGILDLENKYGSIEVDLLEEGSIHADHADVEIDDLIFDLDIDISFADLWIDRVEHELQAMTIEARNAGVNVDLSSVHDYDLSVDGEYNAIDLPDAVVQQLETREDDQFEIKGTIGATGKVKVDIILDGGALKIH